MAPTPGNGDETNGAHRMDGICDDFDRQWATGDPPRLEEYLAGEESLAGNVDQDALFYELLVIELEHRLKRGEQPNRDEYAQRFPGREGSLQRAFLLASDLQVLLGLSSKNENSSTIVLDEDVGATPALQATIERAPTTTNTTTLAYVTDHELLEEIGRGGMGVVFKARQQSLNRIVALKMILSGPWASDEERQRFQQEAQAAAALDHPHIVPVYEVGEYEGRPYFTMRFCAGQSLSALAAQGPFAPRRAAALVAQAADAVAYAHEQGIIHRDIKPANVLVDEGDHVWITDFGLAKRTQDDSNLTATRQVLGTPGYMSPEQARGSGNELTPAADIYSLGAILYRLLTGRPPFQAATSDETLQQVKNAEPAPPRQLNPAAPRDLETICLKCLRKDVRQRYVAADALADDLRRFLRGEPVHARPITRVARLVRWTRRNPGLAGLGAVVCLLLITVTASSLVAAFYFAAARRNETALRRQAETAQHREHNLRLLADSARNRAFQEQQRAALAEGQALRSQQRAETKARANAQTVQFLQELFHSSDPTGLDGLGFRPDEARPAGQMLARDIVQRGVERIRSQLSDQPLVRVELLNALGSVCRSLGMYERAEELLSESVALAQRELQFEGADLQDVKLKWADAARLLARLRHEQGELQQAESLYRRALDILVAARGANSLPVADAKFGLAWVLAEGGDALAAESMMHESLTVRREALGVNHRDVKITGLALLLVRFQQHQDTAAKLASLREFAGTLDAQSKLSLISGVLTYQTGLAYRRQKKYDLAEPCYQKTLALCDSVFEGEDNYLYLLVKGDYAGLLREQGDSRRGEQLIRDVLAKAPPMLRRRKEAANAKGELAVGLTIKGDHRFAEQLFNEAAEAGHADPVALGRLYRALGRYDEAEQAFRASLDPARVALQPPDAKAAIGCELARLLLQRGRLEEAAEVFQKHLAGVREASPDAIRAIQLRDHAAALRELGRDEEAAALEDEARGAARGLLEHNKYFYPFHYHTAPAVVRLLQAEPDAEALARGWVAAANPSDWPHPPVDAAKLFALAEVLRRHGKPEEAEKTHRKALAIRTEKLGAETVATIESLLALAATLHDLNRDQEAETLVDDALQRRGSLLGARHPWSARLACQAAEVLQAGGRTRRAESLLRSSVEITLQTLTATHPQYAACVLQLARLLRDSGQPEAAREILADAHERLSQSAPITSPRRRQVRGLLEALDQ